MTCNQCHGEYPPTEDKAGYSGLCKYCRAETIATEEMRGRIARDGTGKELLQIKKQHNQLTRRIERLEDVISNGL